MNKELNEDARTKQDLLYECSILESRLSNEIIKNENLEQQCEKQKEKINKLEILIENLKLGVTLNQEQEDLLDKALFGSDSNE